MNDSSKTRFVSDVEIPETNLRARSPFKINRENQRRFVRLEIQSPMALKTIKKTNGKFNPLEQDYPIIGEILNISAGGLLIETEHQLSEQDIVAMKFSLQDIETLENVLGLVKRVDQDDGMNLIGIEFVTLEQLQDLLSDAELKLLTESYGDFQRSIQNVLSKYLYHRTEKSHA